MLMGSLLPSLSPPPNARSPLMPSSCHSFASWPGFSPWDYYYDLARLGCLPPLRRSPFPCSPHPSCPLSILPSRRPPPAPISTTKQKEILTRWQSRSRPHWPIREFSPSPPALLFFSPPVCLSTRLESKKRSLKFPQRFLTRRNCAFPQSLPSSSSTKLSFLGTNVRIRGQLVLSNMPLIRTLLDGPAFPPLPPPQSLSPPLRPLPPPYYVFGY